MYANGARLIAVPGWPLPTFCTASAANTRTVSTARLSTSDQSSGTTATVSASMSLICSVLVTWRETFLSVGTTAARGDHEGKRGSDLDLGAVPGPEGVEDAVTVHALVGVGAEEVALSLNERGGQPF